MNWQADLGARHRVHWHPFEREHHAILRSLRKLPSLGKLPPRNIRQVVDVVAQTDKYKVTKSKTLVFGSKAAHIHFPGLVPVLSSEVRRGLQVIEKRFSKELEDIVPAPLPRFVFGSPGDNHTGYWYYIFLGNVLMSGIDSRQLLGNDCPVSFSLNAKVFEWWVVSFGI